MKMHEQRQLRKYREKKAARKQNQRKWMQSGKTQQEC